MLALTSCGGTPTESTQNTSTDSETSTTSVTSITSEDSSEGEGSNTTSEDDGKVTCLDIIYSYKAMEPNMDLKGHDFTPGEDVGIGVQFYDATYIQYTRVQVNDKFYELTPDTENPGSADVWFKVPDVDFVVAFTYITEGREGKSKYKVEFENTNDYLILGLESGESYSTDMRFDIYVYDAGKTVGKVYGCYTTDGYHEEEIEYGYWCVGYPLKEVTHDISLKVSLTDNKEFDIEYSLEWSYYPNLTDFLDVEKCVIPAKAKQGDQVVFHFEVLDGFELYWYFNNTDMDSFAEKNSGDPEGSKVPEYCEAHDFAVKMPKWKVTLYLCPFGIY